MQRKYNKSIIPVAKMLRKNMTKEEKHLWYDFLKMYPIRFSRQKVLGIYVADFYCAKAKLVIELDGAQHKKPEAIEYDRARTAFFDQYDLRVIRIPNTLIRQDFRYACAYIDDIVKQSLTRLRGSSLCTREPER